MKLLPNEEIVESSFRGLTLTTRRIRLHGDDECASMFLQDIASIELKYQVHTYWLGVALLCLLAVFYGFSNEEMGFILVGAACCILGVAMYIFTRKRKFIITSNGSSKISFSVSGISFAKAMELLEGIEGRKDGASI